MSIDDDVFEAINSRLGEDGNIDLYEAASAVVDMLTRKGIIGDRPEGALDWALLHKSLRTPDPYSVIAPEVRALYPLTPAMVQQNFLLLKSEADAVYQTSEMSKPVKDRKRRHVSSKDYWKGRGGAVA